jgi:hypothetical protein
MTHIVSPELEETPVPDDEKTQDEPKPEDESTAPAEPADEPAAEPEAPAEEEGDKFNPGAIAARVAGMGEETDLERIAREEEKKLQERKKGKKGKRGLEAAASKRLSKIGEGKVKRPSALADAAGPDADPLLDRTVRVTEWIKEHRQTFGGIVAVVGLGLAGLLGYTYWQDRNDAQASALLSQGYGDERGAVSDKDEDDETETRAPLYPSFKTTQARRDAALAKYREVESKYAGTGAATLAKLSEAGLLLDAGDGKGAAAAYEDVKNSMLARADAEVRGRAIEGAGFAAELLAQTDAPARDSHLDVALAAYQQLEQVDMKGFKELGKYHEARVYSAKGDKAKAVELLKDAHKAVSEPGDSHPFSYLETVIEDRLRELDPTALPPKAAAPKAGGPGGGGPGGVDMNDPRIQELLRQLKEQGKLPNGPASPPQ